MNTMHSRYDGIDEQAVRAEARAIIESALAAQKKGETLQDAVFRTDAWADSSEARELCVLAGENPDIDGVERGLRQAIALRLARVDTAQPPGEI